MIGRTVGPYRVTAAIGAGGMGEVYRATDSRLSRDVAIKVLPAAFASDAERMARFDREARVLASLSHANIASIFGLEDVDGTRAIVMEMVEGETLAERIARGALPVDDALAIARQVADALEYAHERGVVHRDLKPANIKITGDGTVKVLDFGLAKALEDDPSSSSPDLTKSPTLTSAGTKAGVILGTAAYMSPEQAKGKTVDRRADIFSFGAVLYEMLTGAQAFTGETASETLASVLKDEPDWSALPAAVPPAVRDLLQRCLLKDPKQRLRDIGEARIAIERVVRGEGGLSGMFTAALETSPAASGARASIGRLIAVALPLALVAGLAGWMLHPSPREPLFQADLALPRGLQLDLDNASLALSPDGRTLVMAAIAPGQDQMLWIRPLDGGATTALAGTEGATYPFWSPDGASIGFFANRKLKRVPAAGGVVQSICDATEPRGGTWGPDGTIVFAPGALDGLQRVPASGGSPTSITTLEHKGISHRLPHFLPDGERVLYARGSVEGDTVSVLCLNLRTKKQTVVFQGQSEARYLDPGFLAFVKDRNLIVQRVDADNLSPQGDPIPLAEGLQFNPYRFTGNFAFADRGPLVYLTGETLANAQLTWFDLDGHELGPVGSPGAIQGFPVISPDGRKIAVCVRGDRFDLWMIDIATGTESRFTLGPEQAAFPTWSPDSRELAYGDGSGSVWVQPVESSAPKRQILDMKEVSLWIAAWSPDGASILANVQNTQTSTDVWALPADGKGKPRELLTSPASELAMGFSPDGRWMLYVSSESGREELYAASYPNPTAHFQISTQGVRAGRWMPDGRRIVVVSPDGRATLVDVDASGGRIALGAARPVFSGKPVPGEADITPDEKRLLVAVPEGGGNTTLRLVTDWRELAARHAAGSR